MSASGNALAALRSRFPQLSSRARVTSPQTGKYNCIAFAAGEVHRWWWPSGLEWNYWPKGCRLSESLPAFQQAFETLGYTLCANGDLEVGFEKVAFFVDGHSTTHAARQLEDGMWASKLGQSFDIHHPLHEVGGSQGDAYGTVAAYMKRKRPLQT